ncbi:hypothetical protein PpBr36_08543 [Pyricularia pennisetigena]|uniref:hypothetical protein n=1 Tax=Pyricularia pennisetigena TaxID=1578925 RepID=UPI001153C58C|nr:hypothetical protein PpBr36_08543 [Pyricularia pennisetigena]TLS24331.1 hypothetical protein PpBr36_08543 [Pyricularia pennisetigena]
MSRHPAAKAHYGKPALGVHPHCVRLQPQRPIQTVPSLDSACRLQTRKKPVFCLPNCQTLRPHDRLIPCGRVGRSRKISDECWQLSGSVTRLTAATLN